MKIGLCTGGGDCPGLNSVIRAVVRYAVGTLGHEVIGIEDSFNGLLTQPNKIRKLTPDDVSGILNRGVLFLGRATPEVPSNDESQKIQILRKKFKLS